jgi:cyclin H
MYSTSTQKKHWTFASVDDLNAQRLKTSDEYKQKINSGDHMEVDSVENEAELLKSVTEMGVRFADEFEPKMWPAVKWTAFAYFKRFYLRHSAAEFSPKIIIVACYYLAMKIQEFNVSIHDFTKNLKSESLESNAEEILHWEPILIHRLNYQLTVHCPFRPLEGHLMELKTFGKLRFDVEAVRPHTSEFFRVSTLDFLTIYELVFRSVCLAMLCFFILQRILLSLHFLMDFKN